MRTQEGQAKALPADATSEGSASGSRSRKRRRGNKGKDASRQSSPCASDDEERSGQPDQPPSAEPKRRKTAKLTYSEAVAAPTSKESAIPVASMTRSKTLLLNEPERVSQMKSLGKVVKRKGQSSEAVVSEQAPSPVPSETTSTDGRVDDGPVVTPRVVPERSSKSQLKDKRSQTEGAELYPLCSLVQASTGLQVENSNLNSKLTELQAAYDKLLAQNRALSISEGQVRDKALISVNAQLRNELHDLTTETTSLRGRAQLKDSKRRTRALGRRTAKCERSTVVVKHC